MKTSREKNKREWLIEKLKHLQTWSDNEMAHIEADAALLVHIGDKEIEEEFNKIEKWYA